MALKPESSIFRLQGLSVRSLGGVQNTQILYSRLRNLLPWIVTFSHNQLVLWLLVPFSCPLRLVADETFAWMFSCMKPRAYKRFGVSLQRVFSALFTRLFSRRVVMCLVVVYVCSFVCSFVPSLIESRVLNIFWPNLKYRKKKVPGRF